MRDFYINNVIVYAYNEKTYLSYLEQIIATPCNHRWMFNHNKVNLGLQRENMLIMILML